MKLVIAIAASTQLLVAAGCTSTSDRTTAKTRISYVVPPQQATAGPEAVVNAAELEPRPERVIVAAKQPPMPETVVIAEKEPRALVTVADRPDDGFIDWALLPPDERALNNMHQLNHVHMIAGRRHSSHASEQSVEHMRQPGRGKGSSADHETRDQLGFGSGRKIEREVYLSPLRFSPDLCEAFYSAPHPRLIIDDAEIDHFVGKPGN